MRSLSLYDSLLVDEVQDFPEAKIGLLLRLTSKPSAVLFGGDTARRRPRGRVSASASLPTSCGDAWASSRGTSSSPSTIGRRKKF